MTQAKESKPEEISRMGVSSGCFWSPEACLRICESVRRVFRSPLVAIGIGFTAHAMMASIPSGRSSCSTSWEMDVLTVDISSLPLSIGSAGDLAKRMSIEAAMDVSITAPTDASSEVATEGTVTDQKERNDA